MTGTAPAPMVRRAETGHQRHLGYVTTVFADRSEVRLQPDHTHLNRQNVLHGGVVATILDSALGFACSRHLSEDADIHVVTVSYTVNFIAATAASEVIATGRVTGGGYKTVFAQGEVRTVDGKLLATATGVYKRGKPALADASS